MTKITKKNHPAIVKFCIIMAISVLVPINTIIHPNVAQAGNGNWHQVGNKWWYEHYDHSYTTNDWESIDGYWYHFDGSGWMQTGWLNDSNKWYYLGSNGQMRKYWQLINGDYYYFNSSGQMITGWLQDNSNGDWYYFNSDGKMQTGWIYSNSKWYYANNNGVILKYFQLIDNTWYYFHSDGEMHIGWLQDNSSYYYYYFGDNGKMQTGWIYVDNNYYYLDENGRMQTDWIKLNGFWYYLEDNGRMRTADLPQGSRYYKFNTDGKMYTTEIRLPKVTQGVNWCWAASAVMVGTYDTDSTRTQEDIVRHKFNGQLIHEGATLSESLEELNYASGYTKSGYALSVQNNYLTYDFLVDTIDDNRPFMIELQWYDVNYGHIVVGAGYNRNNNSVRVIDPGQGVSTTYYNYAQMMNGTQFLSGDGYCCGMGFYNRVE